MWMGEMKIKTLRREMNEDGKRKHVFVSKISYSCRKLVETDYLFNQVFNRNQLWYLEETLLNCSNNVFVK